MARFKELIRGLSYDAHAICWLLLSAVAGIVLFGCTTQQPVPTVVTQEVRVPVPFTPEPSAELLACGDERPEFRFYAAPDPGDVIVKAADQPKLRMWVDGKDRCIAAWRAAYRP